VSAVIAWIDEVPKTHGSGTWYRVVEGGVAGGYIGLTVERRQGTDAMGEAIWVIADSLPTRAVAALMAHFRNPEKCSCHKHEMARIKAGAGGGR
jgi:hypothetical protein